MKLRRLEVKDAGLMFEWMHDLSVTKDLSAGFANKTFDDCVQFIENSHKHTDNIHLAIVDDHDEYMGTVSLKHIDMNKRTAEFAIVVCKKAMGKGYASYGMKEMLKLGFEKVGVKNIYWCVSKNNLRAIGFYNKYQYNRAENVPSYIKNNYSTVANENMYWYKATDICA